MMIENNILKDKNIVVIGGGTGTSVVLKALKNYTSRITAIVTVADDGGSSGDIRDTFNIAAPGDIRNCLVALSEDDSDLGQLLDLRLTEKSLGSEPLNFGNLMLAAMVKLTESFPMAVRKVSAILNVTGKVLPVTADYVVLEAETDSGEIIRGESRIAASCLANNLRIRRIRISPKNAALYYECERAIAAADVILFAPGSLFTSLIPNILVEGMVDALRASRATKYWAMNVMTECGETDDFTLSDHVAAMEAHAGGKVVDVILFNNAFVEEDILNRYISEGSDLVKADTGDERLAAYRLEGLNCFTVNDKGYVRHDAQAVWSRIAALETQKENEKETARQHINGPIEEMENPSRMLL